jgi:hypothetical protein
MQDLTLGVVGDGFGALLAYTTAVYLRFRPEQIGAFCEQKGPVATHAIPLQKLPNPSAVHDAPKPTPAQSG